MFKGLILVPEIGDLTPDFPSMFFGTYEEELLNTLVTIPKSNVNFINLGAGDGYYPIGVIKSRIFKKAIAYEASEFRRNQITRLAKINQCEESIEIRGFADAKCFDEYESDFLSKSVILSDIEGGEFQLFNERNLAKLSQSTLILEIHEFLLQDGGLQLERLVEIASKYFTITRLTTAQRDPSRFPELHSWMDIDRWFTVVEGRGPLMLWLLLQPRAV